MSMFRSRTRSGGVRPAPTNPPSTTTTSPPPDAQESPRKGKLSFSDVASMFIRLRRFSLRAGVRPTPRMTAEPASDDQLEVVPVPSTPTRRSHSRGLSLTKSRSNTHAFPTAQSPTSGSSTVIPMSSPPTSPTRLKVRKLSGGMPYARPSPKPLKAKPHHLVSTSGERPITHPGLVPLVQDASEEEESIQVVCQDYYECAGGVNVATLLRATRASIMEKVSQMPNANVLVEEQWQSTICGPKKRNLPRPDSIRSYSTPRFEA
ncbi:hypothetical protein CC2G_013744 [Coprinopsis cinerea AmutBmut pab1-1]|nr:hypothetical protein CC2G_013744 [Coprinopsis cinerea AmutBmut pab1-1]